MNEGKKTGIFWGVAGVIALIAIIASWKTDAGDDGVGDIIGGDLFTWKDPLLASSMKIVTFDEDQGTLANFEVRKDKSTGAWTIPSRNGYPADASDQMKAAANSLIGLKALDNPTSNAEDHSKMGVLEPNRDDLDVGDEGVGRLVTIKDKDQKDLASLIIGNPVKDQEGQIYVRIPGQDPVYSVKLDDTPLTTKFQDWIEDDLLKMSSIEIDSMQVKDYTFQVVMDPRSGRMVPNWQRKYDAILSKDGTQWSLDKLLEYDPKNPLEGKSVEIPADKKINAAKLNEIQSALDDLKIADVARKPDGISANLRADKDLLDDEKARGSLSQRGFYPVQTSADGDSELLSANGELTVALKDGVEYVLRFGNISGVGQKEDDDSADGEKKETVSAGVNRYLLVTTRVDNAHFPPPELKEVPKSVEEMEAAEKAVQDAKKMAEEPPVNEEPAEPEVNVPTEPEPAVEMKKEEPAAETKEEEKQEGDKKEEGTQDKADEPTEPKSDESKSDEPMPEDSPKTEEPKNTEPKNTEPKAEEPKAEEPKVEEPAADQPKADEPKADETKPEQPKSEQPADADPSGETEGEGSGEASGEGQGKSQQDSDEVKEGDEKETEEAETTAKDEKENVEPAAEEEPDEPVEETEEEKQERLEAMQEKITKENQRKLDERNDKIEAAKRKVRDLNARFADWYYVIPEETYAKLTIKREDLFESEKDAASTPNPGAAGPSFGPGGLVPNFGN